MRLREFQRETTDIKKKNIRNTRKLKEAQRVKMAQTERRSGIRTNKASQQDMSDADSASKEAKKKEYEWVRQSLCTEKCR